MEENIEELELTKTNISELNELISIIVDYYCFKNNASDEEEGDEWKKKLKDVEDRTEIIPVNIDSLIGKSFASQLEKFITKKK